MNAVILHMTVSGVAALKVITRRLEPWSYTIDATADGSLWRIRATGKRSLSSDEFRTLMTEVMGVDGAIYEYSVENSREQ